MHSLWISFNEGIAFLGKSKHILGHVRTEGLMDLWAMWFFFGIFALFAQIINILEGPFFAHLFLFASPLGVRNTTGVFSIFMIMMFNSCVLFYLFLRFRRG